MRQYRLYQYSSLIQALLKNSGGCSVSCCSESSYIVQFILNMTQAYIKGFKITGSRRYS